METTVQKLETKRIILYLAITFTLTCAWCFGVVYPINSGGSLRELTAVVTQLAVAAVMLVTEQSNSGRYLAKWARSLSVLEALTTSRYRSSSYIYR